MYDLKLLGGICHIDGIEQRTNIYCKNGRISAISNEDFEAKENYDCMGLHILPGLIDPHVHMALDIGSTVSCDDFVSGSKAAVFGGITTILDFLDPINSNECLQNSFNKRMDEAKGAHIDYGFHCTLGDYHDDPVELRKQVSSLGMRTIKVFTAYSESGRRCAYEVIEKLYDDSVMIMVHAEDDELVDSDHETIFDYESSRDQISEWAAFEKLVKGHRGKNGNLYIVHTSSGQTVEDLFRIYSDEELKGIYLESCPQYFHLDKCLFSEVEGGKYLLAPPIRSSMEVDLLRKNIKRISTIGTDHCPFLLSEKLSSTNASKIPKGIGGIEFSFPLMFTLFGFDILDHYTKNVATLFRLKNKGAIAIGMDADFCIFDPNYEGVIGEGVSKCDYSVYDGMNIRGQVISTISRGYFVLKDHEFLGGCGQYVRRD